MGANTNPNRNHQNPNLVPCAQMYVNTVEEELQQLGLDGGAIYLTAAAQALDRLLDWLEQPPAEQAQRAATPPAAAAAAGAARGADTLSILLAGYKGSSGGQHRLQAALQEAFEGQAGLPALTFEHFFDRKAA